MKIKKPLERLIGKWQTADEDSRAIIVISEKRGKPHVSVFDKGDGEKFKVTKVQLERGVLSFETCVPSNGYRTKNKLRLNSNNVIEQELTLIEMWTRMIELKVSK